VGFIVNACALKLLYVNHMRDVTSFFCTYALCQDHLELLFNAIRRQGGWCNNPTAIQLRHAMRMFMIRSGCRPTNTGNVLPLNDVDSPSPLTMQDEEIAADTLVHLDNVSEFAENILHYLAGWVAHKGLSTYSCSVCCGAMQDKTFQPPSSHFLVLKDKALVYPSASVVQIVVLCEKLFRVQRSFYPILHQVLHQCGSSLFAPFADHFATQSFASNSHYYSLIHFIVEIFFNLRMHHHTKTENMKHKTSMRHTLNKRVLFANQ
jgi:hypothetical protein